MGDVIPIFCRGFPSGKRDILGSYHLKRKSVPGNSIRMHLTGNRLRPKVPFWISALRIFTRSASLGAYFLGQRRGGFSVWGANCRWGKGCSGKSPPRSHSRRRGFPSANRLANGPSSRFPPSQGATSSRIGPLCWRLCRPVAGCYPRRKLVRSECFPSPPFH